MILQSKEELQSKEQIILAVLLTLTPGTQNQQMEPGRDSIMADQMSSKQQFCNVLRFQAAFLQRSRLPGMAS